MKAGREAGVADWRGPGRRLCACLCVHMCVAVNTAGRRRRKRSHMAGEGRTQFEKIRRKQEIKFF